MSEIEETKEETLDENKVLEIIDDVESPEQLKAAQELLLDKPLEETPEKEKVDEEKEPKQTLKEESEETSTEKKIIEINDEYITEADETDKKILESIKGESLSEKALQNYLESQKLIGKKSTEIFELKSEPEERQPQEITIDDEQRSVIAGVAKKQLRQEYPDMPTDAEEYKEYALELQNTDPDKAQEFYDRRREITAELTDDYKQMVYVRENYDVINYNTMKKEVAAINDVFEKEVGFKPEDIGLDLTVDREFSNEAINGLLVNDKGDFDPKVINYYDKGKKTPILNEGKFADKFFAVHRTKILDEVKKRARQEGFESRDGKKIIKELTDISTEKEGDVKTEKLKIDEIEFMDDLEKVRAYRERVGDMIGSE